MKFKPQKHNIVLYENTTHDEILRFEDGRENIIDLTGYTGILEIRSDTSEESAVEDPILTLTTENDGILIDENLGKVTLKFGTVSLSYAGMYDLFLIDPDGNKENPIAPSKIKVIPTVTNPE